MAGKVAVLATLMFALVMSASLIEGARPIVSEGSNVAADGSVMLRDPHSRQLRTFYHGFFGCGGFGRWFWVWNWWGCRRTVVVTPVFVTDDDKRRKLNTFWGWGWGYGRGFWGGWHGWGGWGFGGPGFFYGRK